MTISTSQVLLKHIVTEVAIFTDRPLVQHIQHLKACGFRYDKGQWSRTRSASGIHEAEAVTTYQPLDSVQ